MKTKQDPALLQRFGSKVRQLRQAKNLSQAQLAKKIRVGSRTVFRYEQGTMAPSIEVIARLARFFAVSTDELIFNDEAHLQSFQDRDLIEFLSQADRLPRRERSVLKELLELLLARRESSRHAA